MKKFRFFTYGMAPSSRKNFLSSCKGLSHIFTVADILPGMFSPSLTKRLMAAKKHGTKIVLRRWRNAVAGVVVVDKEQHKLDMGKMRKEVKSLKKKLQVLSESNDVKLYLKYTQQLKKLGK